jgi:hypothetical protein
MSIDVLKIHANERLDEGDLTYGLSTQIQDAERTISEVALLGASQSKILEGFEMDNPAGSQLRVTLGKAILAYRDGATVKYGVLVDSGDAERILDLASYPVSATYSIYVRAEYIDSTSQGRAFWDGSAEISQSVTTRKVSNWGLRIEVGSPGAEWLEIGTVTLDGGGAVTVVTDLRDFYFDGSVDATYESGWSSDGGGIVNDRNSDRRLYGVTDFHAFTAAMRQSLEDIKGRGLRRWWDRDIGGMNIGFDAAPVEDRMAVGDALNYLTLDASKPTWQLDTAAHLQYDRTLESLLFTPPWGNLGFLEYFNQPAMQLTDTALLSFFGGTPSFFRFVNDGNEQSRFYENGVTISDNFSGLAIGDWADDHYGLTVASSGAYGTTLAKVSTTASEGARLAMQRRQSTSTTSYTDSGDVLSEIASAGFGHTTDFIDSALIKAVATEDFDTATKRGTQLEFWTTPNGSATAAKRWEIDDAGNLLPSGSGFTVGDTTNYPDYVYASACRAGRFEGITGAASLATQVFTASLESGDSSTRGTIYLDSASATAVPPSPSGTAVVLYALDNGGGTINLYAKCGSDAAVLLA